MPNPVGRPREVEPYSVEDTIKLGEELLIWATEETEEKRVSMNLFYSLKKMIPRKHWKTIVLRPEFLPYYEAAQSALCHKIYSDTVKEGYGNRLLRLVQKDLIEEENEQSKFDAELKKVQESNTPQKVIFEVNYKNDGNNSVSISPSPLSTADTPSPEQGN